MTTRSLNFVYEPLDHRSTLTFFLDAVELVRFVYERGAVISPARPLIKFSVDDLRWSVGELEEWFSTVTGSLVHPSYQDYGYRASYEIKRAPAAHVLLAVKLNHTVDMDGTWIASRPITEAVHLPARPAFELSWVAFRDLLDTHHRFLGYIDSVNP